MKMKKLIAQLVICTLLATYIPILPVTAAHKPNLAVHQFVARGISNDKVISLTDVLRFELANNESLQVMSSKQMSNILGEAGTQVECDTTTCFAEIARKLGVRLIVSGTVSKMGSIYVLSLELIDSVGEYALNSVTMTSKTEDELNSKVREAAEILLSDTELPEVSAAAALTEPEVVVTAPTKPVETSMPEAEAPAVESAEAAKKGKLITAMPTEKKVVKVVTITRAQPQTEESAVAEEVSEAAAPEVEIASKEAALSRVAEEEVEVIPVKEEIEPVAAVEASEEMVSEPVKVEEVFEEPEAEAGAEAEMEIAEPKVREPGKLKKTIGWTALGVGVAGVALALSQISSANAVYTKATDKYSDADDADTDADEDDLKDEGDTFYAQAQSNAGTARIGLGIAGIGFAVAAYCWLTRQQETTTTLKPQISISPQKVSFSWRF